MISCIGSLVFINMKMPLLEKKKKLNAFAAAGRRAGGVLAFCLTAPFCTEHLV